MSKLDEVINSKLQSSQFAVGVSTLLFSLLSKNIVPKLPPSVYKLLDVTIVRIGIIAFLLTTQTKKPTLSILTSIVLVVGLKIAAEKITPDIPPLSEIVKPETEKENKTSTNTDVRCHCHCDPCSQDPSKVQRNPTTQPVPFKMGAEAWDNTFLSRPNYS